MENYSMQPNIFDLALRLDDGGRIELFTSWSAASWRLETP